MIDEADFKKNESALSLQAVTKRILYACISPVVTEICGY